MALVLADRVEQVTRTTGLGDLQLAETIRGRQSFQDVTNNGDTVIYVLEDAEGTAWEIGEGTVVHGSETTLQRTTIRQSSNGGSKISLSAGTHRVFLAADADYFDSIVTDADVAQAISDHEAAADPHPQYTTTAEASAAAPVQSVNGESGTVLLDATDVGATPASHVGTGGSQHADATTTVAGFMSGADKTKLDTVETNAKDDQSAAEVPYSNATSGLTATDVQAALDEIDGQVDTNTSNISTNASNISTNTTEIDKRTIYVGSVAELSSLQAITSGTEIIVTRYMSGAEVTSRNYTYDSAISKASHDGLEFISPTVPPIDSQAGATLIERVNNFQLGTGETDSAGSGCYVRSNISQWHMSDAGILEDETVNCAPVFHRLVTLVAGQVAEIQGSGRYGLSKSVNFSANTKYRMSGVEFLLLTDYDLSGDDFSLVIEQAENCLVIGLNLDGNEAAFGGLSPVNATASPRGFAIKENVKNSYFIGCNAKNVVTNGFISYSGGGKESSDFTGFSNCHSVNCGIGIGQEIWTVASSAAAANLGPQNVLYNQCSALGCNWGLYLAGGSWLVLGGKYEAKRLQALTLYCGDAAWDTTPARGTIKSAKFKHTAAETENPLLRSRGIAINSSTTTYGQQPDCNFTLEDCYFRHEAPVGSTATLWNANEGPSINVNNCTFSGARDQVNHRIDPDKPAGTYAKGQIIFSGGKFKQWGRRSFDGTEPVIFNKSQWSDPYDTAADCVYVGDGSDIVLQSPEFGLSTDAIQPRFGVNFPTTSTPIKLVCSDANAENASGGVSNMPIAKRPLATFERTVPAYTYDRPLFYRAGVAPTSGTWERGDFVWHSAPTVSTGKILIGFSCVTSGTPGTWEPCYVTNS